MSKNSPRITTTVQGCRAKVKPEWLTIQDAVSVFGLSRSMLYDLMAEGSIKYASIKRRGNASGRRLVSFDSLAAYIEKFTTTEKES